MRDFIYKHLSIILLAGIVTGAFMVYLPGLHSRFLFDDNVNLGQLSQVGNHGYNAYIFSGISGPSGRPLSLLSFALQYRDWPDNPYPFKLVNLVLHLLNGILIYLLLSRLGTISNPNRPTCNRALPIITAGFWLLHPMQVNTVLYVVQRMTELTAFFSLSGILGYLHAKQIFDQGRIKAGLCGMSIAVAIGGIAAILSKENGIVMPLYILIIEMTVLYSPARSGIWRVWAWIFLVSPLVLLCIYLAGTLGNTLHGYEMRSFTMSERLYTEPVVLLQYLQDLIVPHLDAFSLFHDDFPKSTGLLEPVKTLFCHLLIFFMAGYAIVMRKRSGFLSLGILWFLGGHSLEASHVNLELYFEHRNYLPSAGVFMLIALVMTKYWSAVSKYLTFTLFGIYCVATVWITWFQVQVWRHPGRQALEWAIIHPQSPRALDYLGGVLLLTGNDAQALEVYDRLLLIHPFDIYPYVKRIVITYCLNNKSLSDEEWKEIYDKAGIAQKYTSNELNEFDAISRLVENNECSGLDIRKFMKLLIILASNRDYADLKGSLHQMAAVLAAKIGDAPSALANIDEAIRYKYDAVTLIIKLKFMLSLKNKETAQEVLDMLNLYFQDHRMEYLAYKTMVMDLEEKLDKL
jgi:tetratricopeptide (TPR) repeat protein